MVMALALVLLFAIVPMSKSQTPPPHSEIPVKIINLDLAPRQRWQSLTRNLLVADGFNYTYGPAFEYIISRYGKEVLDLIDIISEDLESYLMPEYVEELRGCADVAQEMGYGDVLPLKTIVTLNLLYELTTFCTSIVSEDSQGRIWHSRNMDWSFGHESLKNITIIADFQQGGITQYKTITWVGYVGALTGMRPGVFSVTIDQRFTSDALAVVQAIIRLLLHKGVTVGFLTRAALAHNMTFQAALDTLAYTPLTTSVYYIVGGVTHNEGAVITRKEEHTNVWKMPNGPQPWFILETNYDHEFPPPHIDDRRKLAIEAMETMGQANINAENLFHVMETPGSNGTRGVLNSETQYTVIMSPVQNYFKGYGWK
jgi:N-acylethanolamine-hydrolysing acid amidase